MKRMSRVSDKSTLLKRPPRSARLTFAGLAGMAALLSPNINASAQLGDPVLERQLVMQQLDRDADGLGNALAGIEPPEKLAVYARSIAKGAKEARDSFEQQVPGGSAKSEVWSNHEDFARRMDAFVAKSGELAQAAQAGNLGTVNNLVADALPCKSCHELYRIPKKST